MAVPSPRLPRRRKRPSTAAEAEEGLLLLGHVARMRLRNRIVVDLLTTDGAVDPALWLAEAARVLGGFRRDAVVEAERLAQEEHVSRFRSGRADSEHDYRASDRRNLARRRRIQHLVASGLDRWVWDGDRLRDLVDDARAAALVEVQGAIRQLADAAGVDAEDEAVLQARLDLIRTVDLPALAARAGADPATPDRGGGHHPAIDPIAPESDP